VFGACDFRTKRSSTKKKELNQGASALAAMITHNMNLKKAIRKKSKRT
jgi:hypothetical protein